MTQIHIETLRRTGMTRRLIEEIITAVFGIANYVRPLRERLCKKWIGDAKEDARSERNSYISQSSALTDFLDSLCTP